MTELAFVNVGKIRQILSLDTKADESSKQFFPYIKSRKVMQWGGLADQFDEYERKEGKTLELLKIFKEYNYPICFSTKATWWLYDERYLSLFRGQDNWNCKFSIITLNEDKAKSIEGGVDTPLKRLEAINIYSKINKGGATLRLRPFIIGLTDKDNGHLELIKLAKENGASAVSTEFFCLERRADKRTLERYNKISKVIGFDILKFYIANSKGQGYLRLNRELKLPYLKKMEELCKNIGIRFYVSDSVGKELCENGSCCGLDINQNYSKGQFTEALNIAKRNGVVYFKDIEKHLEHFKDIKWENATGLNTNSKEKRAKFKDFTLLEMLRYYWNTPNERNSPYKYFNGKLIPDSLDEQKNIIYTYANS